MIKLISAEIPRIFKTAPIIWAVVQLAQTLHLLSGSVDKKEPQAAKKIGELLNCWIGEWLTQERATHINNSTIQQFTNSAIFFAYR